MRAAHRPAIDLDHALRRTNTRRQVLQGAAGLGLGAVALGAGLRSAPRVGAQGQSMPGGNEPQGPQVERLVFWTRASPDDAGDPNLFTQMQAVADSYREKIGTEVELVTVPDADFRSRMGLAAPGGEGPDLFGPIAHDWLGEFAVQKIALPVPDTALQPVADFLPQSLEVARYDGVLYGLPLSLESVAFVYNRDMVSEPPTTWDQLVTMATEMTDGDIYGFGFPILDQYYQGAFLHGFGGYIFRYENGVFNLEDIGLNSPGGVEASRFLRDAYHQQRPPIPEAALDRATGGMAQESMMEQGLLAMTITGPWRETPLRTAGINFGVSVLPTLPNGQPMRPFFGAQVMAANAYGEQQDAALDFITYFTGTDQGAVLFESDRKAPARLSVQQSEPVLASETTAAWAEQLQNAVPMPNIPAMQQVWRPWEAATDSIIPPNAPDEEVQSLLDGAVEQIRGAIAQ